MRSFVKQCTFLAIAATSIGAQAPAGRAEGTMPPARTAQGVPRESLEARVRSRMTAVVRAQLGLTDEQARRLAATNQRLDGRRRALVNQEREARASLRVQLDRGDSANAAQVSTLLDRMLQLQRSRLELMEEEQRDLATFLTPVQRARFLGLQEQVRQRIEGMQLPPGARPGPGGGTMRGRAPMSPETQRSGQRPPQDERSLDRSHERP
jgi:Spy/CpxP family protein refolding chaperone